MRKSTALIISQKITYYFNLKNAVPFVEIDCKSQTLDNIKEFIRVLHRENEITVHVKVFKNLAKHF